METKHLPRSPGIYQIVNLNTGKTYVGSANDLQKRLLNHRRELRNGEHGNPKLQRAWRKSGEDAFEVRVLEAVLDNNRLIEREQHWMDLTQSVKTGYNCDPTAGSRLGWSMTPEQKHRRDERNAKPVSGFITPEGAETTVIRPYLFKKQTGMHSSVFYGLKNCRICSWKGWTHVNAKPKTQDPEKLYEGFVDPDGNEVPPFKNLHDFCSTRGLDSSGMTKVYKLKNSECKGWTHRDYKAKPRKPRRDKLFTGFINPDGEQQDIFNLTGFCRDNGLDQPTMYRVIQCRSPQHKGWTYDPALETNSIS